MKITKKELKVLIREELIKKAKKISVSHGLFYLKKGPHGLHIDFPTEGWTVEWSYKRLFGLAKDFQSAANTLEEWAFEEERRSAPKRKLKEPK